LIRTNTSHCGAGVGVDVAAGPDGSGVDVGVAVGAGPLPTTRLSKFVSQPFELPNVTTEQASVQPVVSVANVCPGTTVLAGVSLPHDAVTVLATSLPFDAWKLTKR
jgi:hypothetical protein